MEKHDLSLILTEELIEEIGKRHDHFIFSGMQERNKEQIFTIRKWKGNSATCQGLASQLQIVIFDKYMDDCTDTEQCEE